MGCFGEESLAEADVDLSFEDIVVEASDLVSQCGVELRCGQHPDEVALPRLEPVAQGHDDIWRRDAGLGERLGELVDCCALLHEVGAGPTIGLDAAADFKLAFDQLYLGEGVLDKERGLGFLGHDTELFRWRARVEPG